MNSKNLPSYLELNEKIKISETNPLQEKENWEFLSLFSENFGEELFANIKEFKSLFGEKIKENENIVQDMVEFKKTSYLKFYVNYLLEVKKFKENEGISENNSIYIENQRVEFQKKGNVEIINSMRDKIDLSCKNSKAMLESMKERLLTQNPQIAFVSEKLRKIEG